MDISDPFMTFYRFDDDHGASDSLAENEALICRQTLIMDWLYGDQSADAVLDCLEEQGLGAAEYVSSVEANVRHFVDSGVPYVTNEAGLFVPERLL